LQVGKKRVFWGCDHWVAHLPSFSLFESIEFLKFIFAINELSTGREFRFGESNNDSKTFDVAIGDWYEERDAWRDIVTFKMGCLNQRKANGKPYKSPLGFYKKIGFLVHTDEKLIKAEISGVKIEWNI